MRHIPSRSNKIYVRNSFLNSVTADWGTLSPEIRLSDTIKNFKTSMGNIVFKYRPNELYLLGNGDSVIHHGRIRMGLSALNGQRKRYGFVCDNKCVFCAARPEDEVHFYILSLFGHSTSRADDLRKGNTR